jgi:hypothetical protein
MTETFVVPAVGILTLTAVFVLMIHRLTRPGHSSLASPQWLASFSVARYRVMDRLLSEAEVAFLESQPGCTKELLRGFRRSRQRIFRSYLRSLSRDFNTLYFTLKIALLHSRQDRPDITRILAVQRYMFCLALLKVHVRLALYAVGVDSRALQVSPMLDPLEGMSRQLAALLAGPAPSAARI